MKADAFLADEAVAAAAAARELTVDPVTKLARQAGASLAEGDQVKKWRQQAERSLFFLARGILGCWWLTPSLHKHICAWVQRVPPRRKMLMIPRGHGKTTIVGQCLPIHMWIQPASSNLYFPSMPGSDTRILMAGEKEERAKDHLRVVQHHMESNNVLRALWPHIVWKNARRDSKKWNETEMIVRREHEFPDPSMRAIGVGGAATGAHPNVLVKDDLTTEAAANSPLVMQTAIDWHRNSRALLSSPATDLEFITCTRWTVADLPEWIMQNDPSVEVNTEWRSIVADGKPIYPENFGAEGVIEQLMRQHGTMFPLLYMNTVADSQLVDFDASDLRFYDLDGENIVFDEDERDAELSRVMKSPLPNAVAAQPLRGRSIYDADVRDAMRKRALRRDRAA